AEWAPGRLRHTRQQHLRVDVEVAQLYQPYAGLAQQRQQRRDLVLAVDQAGKAQQIDRAIDPRLARQHQRALDVVEGVADGAVVGIVGFAARRDRAGPQAIQSGIVEPLQRAGIAGVGVDVERAARRARAHGADHALDEARLQQRLTLAALAKAQNRLRPALEVRERYLHHLALGRHEPQAVLRRHQLILILLRDAAHAARVAARRDGHRALPAAEEEVAGRRA